MINTEELKRQDFLPVLLGSDINVYGMARSFHEAYGIRSVAVGKGILPACMNSKIVEVQTVEPRLEEDEVSVGTLKKFAEHYKGMRLLLVPLRRQLYQNARAQSGKSCAASTNSSASMNRF